MRNPIAKRQLLLRHGEAAHNVHMNRLMNGELNYAGFLEGYRTRSDKLWLQARS